MNEKKSLFAVIVITCSSFVFLISCMALLGIAYAEQLKQPSYYEQLIPGVEYIGYPQDEEILSRAIEIGGSTYKVSEIIGDFLNIAFSPSNIGEPYKYLPVAPKNKRFLNSINSPKKKPLWLYQKLYRPYRQPGYHVLNRWAIPLKISTQWPYGLEGQPFDNPVVRDKNVESVIKAQVESLLPSLQSATGLDISYMDPEDETQENFANVRIVYRDQLCTSRYNFFKVDGCLYATHAPNYAWTFHHTIYQIYDSLYATLVPFTPDQPAQVDGMFFPNEKNNIDFAVCTLWRHHTERVIRALITECMARVLGLPNTMANPLYDPNGHNINAVLGAWNDSNAPYSLRLEMAMQNEKRSSGDMERMFRGNVLEPYIWRSTNAPEEWTYDKENKELSRFFDSNIKTGNLHYDLTPYDRYMLELLYKSDLSEGMSEPVATSVLLSLRWGG